MVDFALMMRTSKVNARHRDKLGMIRVENVGFSAHTGLARAVTSCVTNNKQNYPGSQLWYLDMGIWSLPPSTAEGITSEADCGSFCQQSTGHSSSNKSWSLVSQIISQGHDNTLQRPSPTAGVWSCTCIQVVGLFLKCLLSWPPSQVQSGSPYLTEVTHQSPLQPGKLLPR